ncbi:hypothetical protein GCM10022384_63690 [Streptomyces marokkonensis]|uniref:Uncharacterized protein n=1 Tax=Streptomyces marokkonensis TaxID=324855 RepID=A0ABP7SB89_9ACTN
MALMISRMTIAPETRRTRKRSMGRDFPDGAPSPGVEGGGPARGGGRMGGGRPRGKVRAYFLTYSLQSATQLLPAS